MEKMMKKYGLIMCSLGMVIFGGGYIFISIASLMGLHDFRFMDIGYLFMFIFSMLGLGYFLRWPKENISDVEEAQ
jgi:hypothetical protein